jgi:cysteine-rich repeat protein
MDQERRRPGLRGRRGRIRGQLGRLTVLLLGLSFALLATSASAEPIVGGRIEILPGSEIDLGWTGIAHDLEYSHGSFDFLVLKRCSDNAAPCSVNSDCAGGQCVATCDGVADTTCEVTGPAQEKRCGDTLEPCQDASDCSPFHGCVWVTGPPLPLSSGGIPLCVQNQIDAPFSGTIDLATGEISLSLVLRWRIALGEDTAMPCTSCGLPQDDPKLGDQFTCIGGIFNGNSCRVDAVHPMFGGLSFDCGFYVPLSVYGGDQIVRLNELTTATVTRTAELPCSNSSFKPSNKCIDDFSVCATNADCTRCSDDPTIKCTSNGDCGEAGFCAEAPDQPITCNHMCHCGFCDGDATLPCFGNVDCPNGSTCMAGTGSETSAKAPQAKPNDCAQDKNVCGLTSAGECTNTTEGTCSGKPYLRCTAGSSTCEANEAGTCVLAPRSCFGTAVTEVGEAEAGHDGTVSSTLVALACVPATGSPSTNSVAGITGPLAVRWNTKVTPCPICGNGAVNNPCETCDDGNTVDGDGCSRSCENQRPCGDANDDGAIMASDAQRVLQRAVGLNVQCDVDICDVNESGEVQTNDALLVLRKAVGLPAPLHCQYA